MTNPAFAKSSGMSSGTASPASESAPAGALAQRLGDAFLTVRNETERRAAPLSPEDQLVQSMPDASPAKWHRAHVTWFWEQFLLGDHAPGYKVYHPDYAYLFNSYYVSAGPRHARAQRGHLTRPGADEVTAYRRHVDAARHQILQRDVRRQADLADPPPRSRLQSRAAASGADAHRHPACLRAEPDPAGL